MSKLLIVGVILLLVNTFLFCKPQEESKKIKDPYSRPKGEVTMCSPLRGTISLNGVPLEGIKLTRVSSKVGSVDDLVETTYTDNEGQYSFDEVTSGLGIMRFLPHEAVIHQTVEAHYLDEKYLIWYTFKRNYIPLGEFIYYKQQPVLSPEMEKAYKDGYILVNGDLSSTEELVQRINDNIAFISISDLKFPYELVTKEYEQQLIDRKPEFVSVVDQWFKENPNFYTILTEEGSWSDIENELLTPYTGIQATGVDDIEFSDYVSLGHFEEDYEKEVRRLTLNGGVIVNVLNPEGKEMKVRVWFSYPIFNVSPDNITLKADVYNFSINAYNIDPEVVD